MRAITFTGLLFLLLAVASCHKKNNNNVATVPENTWSHDGGTYTATSYSWTKPINYAQLSFYSSGSTPDAPAITFRFTTKPLTAGVYKIVANPTAANELSISARQFVFSYVSTNAQGYAAYISFKDGKMNIYCSGVLLTQDLPTSGGTTVFNFNLSEL